MLGTVASGDDGNAVMLVDTCTILDTNTNPIFFISNHFLANSFMTARAAC